MTVFDLLFGRDTVRAGLVPGSVTPATPDTH
jgi:hypothetical protein